jgi:membrane-associated phospholipid phosphatase
MRAMEDAPLLRWTRALWFRMRHLFWLKLAGTTAFMAVFFAGYFHVLRNPAYPVTTMPWTALDALVPFQPAWIAAYFTLWFYVGVAPGLLLGFRPLVAYGLWIGALSATGLACFALWPTAVPVAAPPGSADFPGFALLQGIDASGNACPSLHVATAVFTAVWIDHLLRAVGAPAWLRLINLAWVSAIAYSTMAIRQHVALDVLAGAALGLAFAALSLRWQPRPWAGTPDYHRHTTKVA